MGLNHRVQTTQKKTCIKQQKTKCSYAILKQVNVDDMKIFITHLKLMFATF